MSSPLANKVVLITGGTKGIGRATAKLFASQGAKVSANYSSDVSSAQSLVSELGGEANCLTIQANAASVPENEKMVQATVQKFGKIDILIPNAGILPMKDLAATTEEDFDAAFAINVKGPYFLCQKAAPHMLEGGRVILLSTTQCAASTVAPPYLLYNSTKGAIEQMVRVMSKDLGRKGIMVNAISPGPTGTDLFYRGKSEQMLKMIASLNPANRIGTPEEVAEAMVSLAGPAGKWISGQTIRVNGGSA